MRVLKPLIVVLFSIAMAGGLARAQDEPTDPFVGLFKHPKVTLMMTENNGQYRGTLTMGENKFPLTGRKSGNDVGGTYKAADEDRDFKLAKTAEGLKLTLGTREYDLERAGRPPRVVGPEDPLPAGKVAFAQKFPAGNYRVVTSERTEDQAGLVTVRAQGSSNLSMKISAPGTDGITTVTMVITRLRTTLDTMGTRLEFDSANPMGSRHPSARALMALVGCTYELTLTPEGRIDQVKGIDEACTRAAAGDAATAVLMKGMKDDIRTGLEGVLMIDAAKALPKKPAGEGDTWNASIRVAPPRMPESQAKGKATLRSLKDQKAVISFTGEIDPNEKPEPGVGMEIKLKSEFKINTANGLVHGSASTLNVLFVMGNNSRKIEAFKSIEIEPVR